MKRVRVIVTLLLASLAMAAKAQSLPKEVGQRLSLEQAIEIAHTTSPQAQMAELSFMSDYWSYRTYKAELLPSINLNGGLGNYNHSIVEVRDSETGEINYVANNTLTNNLSLSAGLP